MKSSYDPFSAEVIRAPHAFYERMREESPVCPVERFNCFAITRFHDIWSIARDYETFTVEHGTTSAQLLTRTMGPYPALGNLDPPRHHERRKLVTRLLSRSAVRALEPTLRAVAKDCMSALRDGGEVDAVTDLAASLGLHGLCLSTGLPVEDVDELRPLINAISAREPGQDGISSEGVAAYEGLADYSTELVRAQKARPTDDGSLVEILVAAEVEEGRRLTEDEIASHLREFLIGGTETFLKAFSACVARLEEHPDQRAEVVAQPELSRSAFMESLRFDTPGQFMGRTATRDAEVSGTLIRKGQVVLLIWPSGNRDPREFDRPDEFSIHRRIPRMLAFGAGIHDCLGRHLALAQGAIGIEALLDAAPGYVADRARSTWLASEFIQGYTSLPIRSE